MSYINEPEAIFPLGVYADRIVEGMDEDSPYFNVAQSLEERAKMVETLRTLPSLLALKIVHKSSVVILCPLHNVVLFNL